MDFLHIIIPLVVGGVIGYCTNYIAIKMLFRPRKAIYIGKHQLPFTPGIIPKNQKRLANAIGDAVNDQLLTKEAVIESLGESSEKYISKLAESICDSDMSIMAMLPEETESEEIIGSVSSAVSDGIMEKVSQIDIDSVISKFWKEALNSFLSNSPMLAMMFNADMQNMIFEKLGNSARDYINANGEEVINEFVSEYIKEMADKPIGEFVPEKENKDRMASAIENIIRKAAGKHGANILDQIDIKGIVAQRIEAMEVEELEELVLSVMKQELQAVINLGAVIGAVIGIINIILL